MSNFYNNLGVYFIYFSCWCVTNRKNKYCDCLYYHSLCNILYALQPFYTININFWLLQPDTDFIGVSNIQVCLGLQVNANTISGAGSRGQRSGLAHEIERMVSPFEHKTGLFKSRNSNRMFSWLVLFDVNTDNVWVHLELWNWAVLPTFRRTCYIHLSGRRKTLQSH